MSSLLKYRGFASFLVIVCLIIISLILSGAIYFKLNPKIQTQINPQWSNQTKSQIPEDIHKIKHVVIIMQENRSFDHYFGTYPGADGIPMKDGVPAICVPDPATNQCVKPFHDTNDLNREGPHGQINAINDINGGKMDGFVAEQEKAFKNRCQSATDPNCAVQINQPEVMGYHDDREIPNYWAYAKNFVLQDKMFEPNASWSLPEHLFMVSEWSAKCQKAGDPLSCIDALQFPDHPPDPGKKLINFLRGDPNYAWTDLTFLLHKNHVSWGYYVFSGNEPDCQHDNEVVCPKVPQNARTPGIWNPLPFFDTVKEDNEESNIQSISNFYQAAKTGNLPAVSWVIPTLEVSEHSPGLVSSGQAYVTGIINTIMQGSNWDSTAIFISWDDWGGFYDHVVPPKVDENGYGLRVPGLLISPYAKKGYIDHQILSFDAYVKFIEDDFLNGARIDPLTDGRPDSRPNVRENAPQLGNLVSEFDFSQSPRPVFLLPNGVTY